MFKLIRAFVKKELMQALRDPRMKIVLFITPVIQLILFGLALENEVKNVKFYARPMMNDPMFVDISRNTTASGWFDPVNGGEKEIGENIDRFNAGTLDLALYAPEGGLTQAFERGLNRMNIVEGDLAYTYDDAVGRLEAVIDGSDLIRARGITGYIGNIVARENGERLNRTETYDFQTEAQTKLSSSMNTPLEFIVRVLYNPEFVTSYNLVPGVICMLTCIVTIMLTSMSIAKEKEIGTFETLISAPVTITEILLGKTLPYVIIGSVNLPVIFLIAVVAFKVPMRGSYFFLIVASIFFLITTVSIGTLISTIAKSQQQAMMGSFIFLMPAILLSGIMYPVDNLPFVFKIAAWLDPLMYYTMLLRNIMLKGGDIVVIASYTGAIILISIICVTAAFKKFKLHLN